MSGEDETSRLFSFLGRIVRRRARAKSATRFVLANEAQRFKRSLNHHRSMIASAITAQGFVVCRVDHAAVHTRISGVIYGEKGLGLPGDRRIPLPVLISPGKSDLIINHVINCRATCAGQFFLRPATNESRSSVFIGRCLLPPLRGGILFCFARVRASSCARPTRIYSCGFII
jgi:hypothetical protein